MKNQTFITLVVAYISVTTTPLAPPPNQSIYWSHENIYISLKVQSQTFIL